MIFRSYEFKYRYQVGTTPKIYSEEKYDETEKALKLQIIYIENCIKRRLGVWDSDLI